MKTILGELVDAAVTDAWQHEALEFTPWLAENLGALEKVVGIPMEIVGKEVPVGKYKADILATNAADGSNVLIENQLYQSDHGHVGQILTYLAGLNAKTVIWIAADFREEHRSAISWPNEHTKDDISFFAIKLRVVKIGNSPMAPLFDIVEQPNNWDRKVEKIAAVKTADERTWRQEFWDRYVQRIPHSEEDRGGGGQGTSRWRNVPDSDLIVARWVGEGSVSVFIRGDRGVCTPDVYEELQEREDELQRLLGVEIGDDEWYPFEHNAEFNISDSDEADRAIDWLENETVRFIAALKQVGA